MLSKWTGAVWWREEGGKERGIKSNEIPHVQVPAPHSECNQCVAQNITNIVKNENIKEREHSEQDWNFQVSKAGTASATAESPRVLVRTGCEQGSALHQPLWPWTLTKPSERPCSNPRYRKGHAQHTGLWMGRFGSGRALLRGRRHWALEEGGREGSRMRRAVS